MMTDNKGLLTQLETSLPYIEPFPNLTLSADWDVTNEIVCSIRQLQTHTTLAHVKGHQDDHVPYDDLPLDAQLNVDADAEAGYYQQMFPAQRPLIPRLPSNHAQLHISGQVICSHVKSRIREAFTVPNYQQYLEARFKWTSQEHATVDWKAYTQSIGRFRTQRIQVTKLCNLFPCKITQTGSIHRPQLPTISRDKIQMDFTGTCYG
jgi:hypothetical protein